MIRKAMIAVNVVLGLILVQSARFAIMYPRNETGQIMFAGIAGFLILLDGGYFLWTYRRQIDQAAIGTLAAGVRLKRDLSARGARVRQRIVDRADEP